MSNTICCRGSMALKSGCGKCPRCLEEIKRLGNGGLAIGPPPGQEDLATKRAEALAAIKKAEYHIHDILVGEARFWASTTADPNDSISIICDALKKAKALLSDDQEGVDP